MPSHHKIQSRFADGLLNPDIATPKNLLGLGDEEPKKRYNVYRNNVTISLIESMKATFPVILRLLGPQVFDPMARQFIQEFPPTSPVLMTYGAGFPKFISTYNPVKQISYLADIASCELLYLQTYHGGDATPIAIDALSTHAPETLASLTFSCHPSARFFISKWPVGSIWFTNKFDDEVKPLDAERGGESILFIRPQMEVIAHIITEDLQKFLSLIASGAPLGVAAEKVLTQFPEFDIQNALGAMFHFGLITKIH